MASAIDQQTMTLSEQSIAKSSYPKIHSPKPNKLFSSKVANKIKFPFSKVQSCCKKSKCSLTNIDLISFDEIGKDFMKMSQLRFKSEVEEELFSIITNSTLSTQDDEIDKIERVINPFYKIFLIEQSY